MESLKDTVVASVQFGQYLQPPVDVLEMVLILSAPIDEKRTQITTVANQEKTELRRIPFAIQAALQQQSILVDGSTFIQEFRTDADDVDDTFLQQFRRFQLNIDL